MKQTPLRNKIKKGFTLIELLLVVSLVGIAFGVTSDILISLVRSQTKTQVMNSLEQQANFFSLKLEKDLRNAFAVEDYPTHDGIKISGKSNGIVYEVYYYYSGGVLYRQGDGFASVLAITSNSVPGGVTVSCISASCFAVSGATPTRVTISMKFSPATSGAQAITPATTGFVNIESTFVVRGTY